MYDTDLQKLKNLFDYVKNAVPLEEWTQLANFMDLNAGCNMSNITVLDSGFIAHFKNHQCEYIFDYNEMKVMNPALQQRINAFDKKASGDHSKYIIIQKNDNCFQEYFSSKNRIVYKTVNEFYTFLCDILKPAEHLEKAAIEVFNAVASIY